MLESLILLAVFVGGGPHEGDLPLTEIVFCEPEVPDKVMDMNASFNVIYTFELDSAGRPTKTERITDRYGTGVGVTECLKEWRLPGQKPGSQVTVFLYWKHGMGWTQMTISGENIRQRISRSGASSPYAGRAIE